MLDLNETQPVASQYSTENRYIIYKYTERKLKLHLLVTFPTSVSHPIERYSIFPCLPPFARASHHDRAPISSHESFTQD